MRKQFKNIGTCIQANDKNKHFIPPWLEYLKIEFGLLLQIQIFCGKSALQCIHKCFAFVPLRAMLRIALGRDYSLRS